MNPYEQFLQQLLGSMQPPAPRDATQIPMPQQAGNPTPSIYELFRNNPQIQNIMSSGPGYNVVQDPYGNVMTQKGPLAWRNNNPGNIRMGDFAKSRGSVGESAGFAVFPTQEQGMTALRELLFQPDSKYRNLTVARAISKFAPPQDKNDTKNYTKFVTSLVGTNAPIGKLSSEQQDALLNAILRMEGFLKGGQYEANGKTWSPPVSIPKAKP